MSHGAVGHSLPHRLVSDHAGQRFCSGPFPLWGFPLGLPGETFMVAFKDF